MTKLLPPQYRRVKPMGAPGLAFETWDPSNQFPLETPTFLFVIPSEAEGSAVSLHPHSDDPEYSNLDWPIQKQLLFRVSALGA
jgi:hypothetical protein